MKHLTKLLAISALALASTAQGQIHPMKNQLIYPKAPTADVYERYFGIPVADPFRPLENDTAAVTLAWVDAENEVTRSYLDAIPFRDKIVSQLTNLYDFRNVGMPSRGNDGRYYVYENDGKKNQAVLYTMTSPKGKRKVFIDPNTFSKDGTVAMKSVAISEDGKLTAYNISRNGSDWEETHVIDTKTGKKLPDVIEWVKFSSPVWSGNGFYYSAYPKPEAGKEFSNSNEGHNIYYHRIGTSQDEDVLVYSNPANPFHFHTPFTPAKSKVLFVYTSGEGIGNGMLMHRLGADGLPDPASEWVTMVPDQTTEHGVIGVIDDLIYIHTYNNAPNGRIMVADVSNPAIENWRELVPESDAVLAGVKFAGDRLVLDYIRDAHSEIMLADLQGKNIGRVDLPGIGSAGISSSRKTGDEAFLSFVSYTNPGTIYRLDLGKGTREVLEATKIPGYNPDDYVTEQVFYTSKDGTRVPMSITRRKDVKPDGKNPVLLYGYGGFNYSLSPTFRPWRLLWLDNGGIYAEANLRGGSEYGDKWHEAGTKMQKQNVFDDFIAAGEYLINSGWTGPENLTIMGGSNGGLLVGAVVNQRPDLFAVAIPQVGVMDMMRYHLFTIGWNWAADYGRSDDSPEMAKYLLGYSPLHNIRSGVGTRYPAILVTTADHDDRVVPAHSFKYAATLQEANTGPAPKLIRIDKNAGHGQGKSKAKTIDEYADIYSFIFQNLELQPK